MKNENFEGIEALDKAMVGVDRLDRAVSSTMGAAGRNAAYREYGRPITTNDGISIARKMNPEIEIEAFGKDYVEQAAQKTDEEAGDGTSTAICLTSAMMRFGVEKIKEGVNPMKLRREMSASVDKIIHQLKEKSIPVSTDEELFNIANISMEDEKIATLIKDSFKRVGLDGRVIVDESSDSDVKKEEYDGMRFDRGIMHDEFITDIHKQETVLEDIYILVSDKKLSMIMDIFPLWESLMAKGIRYLLVMCDTFSGELLATADKNARKGIFLMVPVRKPHSKELMQDVATIVGATAITESMGINQLDASHFEFLGKAKRVIVGKENTLIIGGEGKKEKIEERVASIRKQLETAENYEKKVLDDRLAKLTKGVVIIKVGGPTTAMMKYTKKKVDDAVNATKAAMEEGIVIGGGKTLYELASTPAENEGDSVVKRALMEPIKWIIKNSGEDAELILEHLETGEVFDVRKMEVSKDPMKDGIIDPTKVERCALKNATEQAALLLTTQTIICDIPEKKEDVV